MYFNFTTNPIDYLYYSIYLLTHEPCMNSWKLNIKKHCSLGIVDAILHKLTSYILYYTVELYGLMETWSSVYTFWFFFLSFILYFLQLGLFVAQVPERKRYLHTDTASTYLTFNLHFKTSFCLTSLPHR